ncbi:MAG: hypothetical protein ACLPH3_23530 [Terracidiphilus sp.]
MTHQTEILKQIDAALEGYKKLLSNSKYAQFVDIPGAEVTSVVTFMRDCIQRLAPPNSQYVQAMKGFVDKFGALSGVAAPEIAGVLTALRDAYALGYLTTVSELIHADLFSDFIEMAEYLMSEGYKDPAAVIVGSVLEEHLRQLCAKSGLPTTAGGKSKKADKLNADLANASVYSKLDLKSITSWLDLRNKAAHGKYSEYTKEQVQLLIQSIQDFMTRNPA